MRQLKIDDISFCRTEFAEASQVQGGRSITHQLFLERLKSLGITDEELKEGYFYEPTTGIRGYRNLTLGFNGGRLTQVKLMPDGMKFEMSASVSVS